MKTHSEQCHATDLDVVSPVIWGIGNLTATGLDIVIDGVSPVLWGIGNTVVDEAVHSRNGVSPVLRGIGNKNQTSGSVSR